jgi:hypothetical protein
MKAARTFRPLLNFVLLQIVPTLKQRVSVTRYGNTPILSGFITRNLTISQLIIEEKFYDLLEMGVGRNTKIQKLEGLNTAVCVNTAVVPERRVFLSEFKSRTTKTIMEGDRKGLWAIDVSKNWRIIFKFQGGNVYVVDYEDYH